MKPYYDHARITIYHGDCREILPRLEPVDLVFTSPPYNLGNFIKGSKFGKHTMGSRLQYESHDDSMPPAEYRAWQRNILTLCYGLLNKTGAIFYNHKPRIQAGLFDDRKDLIPFPIRQEIVWDRGSGFNFSGSFFCPTTERIYIIAKEAWKPTRECLSWGEVWRVNIDQTNKHPAPFPLALAMKVIVAGSQLAAVILDPLAGSCTTAVAAKNLGRKCICVEIEEKYCEIGASRLAQEVLPYK